MAFKKNPTENEIEKKLGNFQKNIHVDFYFHRTMFKSLESLKFFC